MQASFTVSFALPPAPEGSFIQGSDLDVPSAIEACVWALRRVRFSFRIARALQAVQKLPTYGRAIVEAAGVVQLGDGVECGSQSACGRRTWPEK